MNEWSTKNPVERMTVHKLNVGKHFRILIHDSSAALPDNPSSISAKVFFVTPSDAHVMDMSFSARSVAQAKVWAITRLREVLSEAERSLSVSEALAVAEWYDDQKASRS